MEKPTVKNGECFLIKDRVSRRYFSGVDIAEGFLLFGAPKVYFTDMRYFSAAKEKLAETGYKAEVLRDFNDVVRTVKENGIRTVYIDYKTTTVAEYEEYKKFFGEIKDCSEILSRLRSVKSEKELNSIKKACVIAERAVQDAFGVLRAGMTEIELKSFVEKRMADLGAEETAFDTIVAFGKNAAVPHHETGADKLKAGSVVLIDTGAKVDGYCSDITRTAFFGTPDTEFLSAYEAVLSANVKAEREIRAGITGKAADKIARDLLAERGYGEYFTHSLGHGVGLNIHENPYLSPKSDEILCENAVFTIEPGVYIEGKFGIRIEDTCVLKDGSVKRLFNDDKKPLIITAEK